MSVIVKSGVPGKVPTTSQLEYGQLALNYADQKIYFKNSANQVIQFGQTYTNNLNFSGTGLRLTGDFSNATIANRLMFQTSTVNGSTGTFFIPNGTGTSSAIGGFNNSDTTNAAFVSISANGSVDARISSGITGTGAYLPMTFYTGSSERLRIDSSGNVGVGTASPAKRLSVSSGTSANGIDVDFSGTIAAGTEYSAVRFTSSPVGFVAAEIRGVNTNGGSNLGLLQMFTAGSERLRIDSSGNVGIGMAPVRKLDVSGAINSTYLAVTGSGGAFNTANRFGVDHLSNYARIYSSGPNTSTRGGFAFYSTFSDGTGQTNPMTIDTSGNTTFTGTLIESSTIRIKENIRSITNGLEIVLKLRGVVYDRIDTSQKNEPGLIAEEVAEVVKDLVVYDEEGIPSGVKYTKTVAYLIEAVKELSSRLKTLEDKQNG